jgi:hypothetical protein
MDELDDKILTQGLDLKDWLKNIKLEQEQNSNCSHVLQTDHVYKNKQQHWVSEGLKRVRRKIQGQVVIELSEVRIFSEDDQVFWGSWIDTPKVTDKIIGLSLPLRGWVLGRKSKVTAIKIEGNGVPLVQMALNVYRSDVTRAYLLQPPQDHLYGYDIHLNLQGLSNRITLRLYAIFVSGECVAFTEIKIRKYE